MEFVFEHATMIAVIAVVVIILAILASGYVKAPPDTAFIISGFKKGQRILIGKAGIKLPFFERLDKLSLKLVAIDVKTTTPFRPLTTSIFRWMQPSTSKSGTNRRSSRKHPRTS